MNFHELIVWDPMDRNTLHTVPNASTLTKQAANRWEQFFGFCQAQEELGPHLASITGEVYFDNIFRFVKCIADEQDALADDRCAWSTINTLVSYILSWGRSVFKEYGKHASPQIVVEIESFGVRFWQLSRSHGGETAEWPWPQGANIDYTKPPNRILSGKRNSSIGGRFKPKETSVFFPVTDALRLDGAWAAGLPWWIRFALMRIQIGIAGLSILFCPRLGELKDVGFTDASANWFDLDNKVFHIRGFKNKHKSLVERDIPLTDEWVAELRGYQKKPTTMAKCPDTTQYLLNKYLRPVCVRQYGEELGNRINICSTSLRVMAFNDLMRQLELKSLKPHEWLMLNQQVMRLHDHTLATGMSQYSKSIPFNEQAALVSKFKAVVDEPTVVPDERKFAEEVLDAITGTSLLCDETELPHVRGPNRYCEENEEDNDDMVVEVVGPEPRFEGGITDMYTDQVSPAYSPEQSGSGAGAASPPARRRLMTPKSKRGRMADFDSDGGDEQDWDEDFGGKAMCSLCGKNYRGKRTAHIKVCSAHYPKPTQKEEQFARALAILRGEEGLIPAKPADTAAFHKQFLPSGKSKTGIPPYSFTPEGELYVIGLFRKKVFDWLGRLNYNCPLYWLDRKIEELKAELDKDKGPKPSATGVLKTGCGAGKPVRGHHKTCKCMVVEVMPVVEW